MTTTDKPHLCVLGQSSLDQVGGGSQLACTYGYVQLITPSGSAVLSSNLLSVCEIYAIYAISLQQLTAPPSISSNLSV